MLHRLKAYWNPYSVEGLKLRAEKLPDCAYKVILELSWRQLENGKVDEATVRKVIEYTRAGKFELLKVAIGMLNLSHEQCTETLALLKTGKIK